MDQSIHKKAMEHLVDAYRKADLPSSTRQEAERTLRVAIQHAQDHAKKLSNTEGPSKAYRYLQAFQHHVSLINKKLTDKKEVKKNEFEPGTVVLVDGKLGIVKSIDITDPESLEVSLVSKQPSNILVKSSQVKPCDSAIIQRAAKIRMDIYGKICHND